MKLRLAILYGGRSAEHQISVVSARSVMEALDPERFEAVPIGITQQGAWLLPARSPLELNPPDGTLPEVEAAGAEVALRPEQTAALTAPGLRIDVVFPILHGPYGEDGTVQGLFELADLPYVGSGVLASALAMDKAMAKVVLAQAGLPQAPYLVVHERAWDTEPDRVAAEVAERLGWPVFTKPARLGSSIGITKVKAPGELAGGLAAAFAHDAKALVEQGIAARELECGVIGNDAPEASVVGEVVPGREFYDFEATGRVLLNEVNTIPGFTPKSMFPMLWAASGLAYPDLVARLVDLAVERHAARKR
jgi:D-alanine-D-alanine ligase